MKYILALAIVLFGTSAYSYETLMPVNHGHVFIQQPVMTQTYVYNTQYFTVTVPVPVQYGTFVAQPVQHTVYWGYPYQPVVVQQYVPQRRCGLFNFNY